MCEGGNVRSVGLGYLLKEAGQDTIACSWRFNTPETIDQLCEWADKIVIMQEHFQTYIPRKHRHKLRCVDVGEDKFGNPFHPDLQRGLKGVIEQWKHLNFDI